VLQRLNQRHFLNFEQPRARDATPRPSLVDATDVEASDLWEETFGEHLDSKPRGPTAVGIDVSFEHSPVLVGLAEHASRLHLAAPGFTEPYRLYNLDVFEYEVDVPMAIYGNIPFVTSIHQWPGGEAPTASGFLVVNPSEGFVNVEGADTKGANESSKTWWLFESGVLDMFSFAGPTPESVLQQYYAVTGWPRLPPLAALGKHQSRWNYVDVEDVLKVDRGFDEADIPYDVLWLDLEHTDAKRYFTWHPKHFADAGRMLDSLAKSHRKVVTIIDPHIKGDDNYTIFSRLQAADVLIKNSSGAQYEGFCWPGPSYYPDFCSPAAREVWAGLFAPSVYPHSRPELYTWNDMNEPSVFDGPEITMPRDNLHRCHTDSFDIEHRDVHNVYGFFHHQASVEGQLARAPDVRPFVLTRSFFAGSHRHGPVWTGDNMAQWEHLARSVPMLLSLSLCGLSFSGADVGGFMGDPPLDLLLRWHQLGIWYPFYRAHAHLTTKRREPWLFGPQVTAMIREAVLTRYQLLPMWYTLIAEWALRGLPVLRPVWYHDLADTASYAHADEEFLVGQALLVRAVARQGSKPLEVYLPPGRWFDYWDQNAAARQGGEAFTMKPDPMHVPVFVKSGHIIMQKLRPRRSTGAMISDPYTVVIFGTPARGRVYVDDGSSHEFATGAFIYDELTFDGAVLRSQQADFASGGPLDVSTPRTAPAVPSAGLRIERLIFVGLPRRPSAARLREVGGGGRDLPLRIEEAAGAWRVEAKDPAVRLGPPYGWEVELAF